MDLASFSEEVLDAVAGLCGDAVVESHSQAADVLDALARRPGRDRRELAAILGMSLQQLECCRHRGDVVATHFSYADMCQADAIYAGNLLIQRINEAAHWREEFRDLQNAEEIGNDDEGSDGANFHDEDGDADTRLISAKSGDSTELARNGITTEVRARASALLAKHLDASEPLRHLLTKRLEEEIFERQPSEKDFRHAARSIAASLRRNTMLAAGYTAGRIPPQWIVNANGEALVPRLQKMATRADRVYTMKECACDEETSAFKAKARAAGLGMNLQPPAQNDLGGGKDGLFD